jgi:hypothetical protein
MRTPSIDSLLNSLDEDTSDWTKRGVIRFFSLQDLFKKEIRQIEVFIQKSKRDSTIISLLITFLSGFASTSSILAVIERFLTDSMKDEYIMFGDGIAILAMIFDLIITLLVAYFKIQNYEEKLIQAYECKSEYMYLLHEIESQLYRKSKFRCPMSELMKQITRDHEKVVHKQTSQLGLFSFQLMEDMNDLEQRITDNNKEADELVEKNSTNSSISDGYETPSVEPSQVEK